MTRPSRSARPSPAVAAAMSGAVDLSALKERADARSGSSTPPAGDNAAVVTVSEANFEAEVLERSSEVPVVVVLGSSRSEASAGLTETFERLAATDNGTWVLAKVDVEANMRIAQAFGVQAIPTVIAVAAGQPLADFQGVQGEAQLRQWIDAILRAVEGKLSGPRRAEGEPEPEADPRFVAAETAMEEGDLERAQAAYQEILDAEPGNTEAAGALRQLRFYARASELPQDAVTVADGDQSNVDAQLDAADAELFAQLPDAAFDRLIATIKRTAGDDRTKARTRLLELFELFDPAEPFVVAARRKLATALY